MNAPTLPAPSLLRAKPVSGPAVGHTTAHRDAGPRAGGGSAMLTPPLALAQPEG